MKTTLIAIIAALTIPAFAEVPKGVDRKWDRTLTVRVVKVTDGRKTIRVTATAPAAGELTVRGNNLTFKVPAGKTISKDTKLNGTSYSVTAYYSGKVLDVETDKRKTGLGITKGDSLRGGGLGDRKKVGK